MGILFPKRNKEANKIAAEVMRPSITRWPLMICLLIAIAALYWRNFERRLTEIEASTFFYDETASWTKAERHTLAESAKLFREQWGIRLVVHEREKIIEVPKISGNTLFIGLAKTGDTSLILPGLASHSLKAMGEQQGRDIRHGLEAELGACIKTDVASSQCLNNTLNELKYLLSSM